MKKIWIQMNEKFNSKDTSTQSTTVLKFKKRHTHENASKSPCRNCGTWSPPIFDGLCLQCWSWREIYELHRVQQKLFRRVAR